MLSGWDNQTFMEYLFLCCLMFIFTIFLNDRGHEILNYPEMKSKVGEKRIQNERIFSPKKLYNSTFYEVSESATGVILRQRHHLVASTQKQDFCEVVGEGLHHATTGTIAKLTIEINKTCAREHKSDEVSHFSVLAVGKNHIFSFEPSAIEEGTTGTEFSCTPAYPGTYDLYVEGIVYKRQWQVSGSPFQLVVEADALTKMIYNDELPSCQTLQIPHSNLSWIEGHWLTRELTRDGQDTLRSGWVYQPKACNFDIFTESDISMAAASPVPKTIVVLGTSTERGIFLSLIDLALKEGRKTSFQGI
ncbi:hypothetical protein HOLleu_06309 [Holothuria leucospilota]|uniref:Uncharacterized protein n=1 Tax=Holothuria leucospilota TaxID=206669 RepID=A0A9Q1CL22_HOLLE|nr:hypothetical protein HOLleu_06309 [Holothuria leucospilota]